MHPILNNIIIKNGVKYLRISTCNWNKYLDIVAPYRTSNETDLFNKCSISYEYNVFWCDTCNSHISNWQKSCIQYIKEENLYKYSHIFLLKNEYVSTLYKKII